MSPLTGFELFEPSGLVQCMWKRTLLPTSVQSVLASTGLCRDQSQVLAQTSMTPTTPLHWNLTRKQHVVPVGVPATAWTQISPTQPGGTGFGAGVWSVLTSVALKPGQIPAITQLAPVELLQSVSTNRYVGPAPGQTGISPKCL